MERFNAHEPPSADDAPPGSDSARPGDSRERHPAASPSERGRGAGARKGRRRRRRSDRHRDGGHGAKPYIALFTAVLLFWSGIAFAQATGDRAKLEEVRADLQAILDDIDAHLAEGEAGSPSPDPTATGTSGPTTEPTTEPSPSPSTSDPTSERPTATTPPAAAPGDADRVLSGDQRFADGFTVPAGETWAFAPGRDTTVEVSGNVVVRGTLQMRPDDASVVHTLEFTGIDETEMVGGHTETPVASDVGLWVVGDGRLDLVGTPRQGWNRSGTSSTWRAGDDLVVAPMQPGDVDGFESFEAGSTVPSVTAPDGTVHRAEVANLTRNVRIHGGGSNPDEVLSDDGRAHVVCLSCNQPQTLKYVELRWVGPRTSDDRDGNDGLLGRYGLHFHMNGNGSRGTIVQGVVVRDAGNHAFVPHTSHGITFRDTVSYDTYESAYWWDPGDLTDDTLYDHALAMRVLDHPSYRGYDNEGFSLEGGTGNAVVDSAAVGVVGQKVNAGGFHWPSAANQRPNVWRFENNVAHNNQPGGFTAWQNDHNAHVVADSASFNNVGPGVSHGAYRNSYEYRNVSLFNNGTGIAHHAVARGQGQRWVDVELGGDDLVLASHQRDAKATTVYEDLRLQGGRIVLEESGAGGEFVFRSTAARFDLSRDDFVVRSRTSSIRVVNADGSSFGIR